MLACKRQSRRLHLLAGTIAGLTSACAERPAPSQQPGTPLDRTVQAPAGGPTLRLIDSIELQESDTAYVGRLPYTFAVDDSGAILIADPSADRLFIFNRGGSLTRIVGHHGGGPGEFERIGSVTLPYGPWLLQDARGTSLTVLERQTAREVTRLHYVGVLGSVAATGEHLFLGLFSEGTEHVVSVTRWDSISAGRGEMVLQPSLLALPLRYSRYPELALFNHVIVAATGNSLLVGFGATDWLVRTGVDGGPADTVEVPTRVRRGAPPSRLPRFQDASLTFHDAVSSLSHLLGAWFMNDGHLVLWYQEAATSDRARRNADITGHAVIAVLSQGLDRACLETILLAPGSNRTRLAFSRDTLYSLDQNIGTAPDGAATVQSIVRRYAVDLAPCRWVPTRRGGVAP